MIISFTDLLQQYKLKVLLNIIEGWEELTNEQKLMCSKVNNFLCALYLLVTKCNMAECAFENVSGSTVNILTDDEDNDDENERKQTLYNESNTIALLRFCSKCFSCGGDERCGSYSDFKV